MSIPSPFKHLPRGESKNCMRGVSGIAASQTSWQAFTIAYREERQGIEELLQGCLTEIFQHHAPVPLNASYKNRILLE